MAEKGDTRGLILVVLMPQCRGGWDAEGSESRTLARHAQIPGSPLNSAPPLSGLQRLSDFIFISPFPPATVVLCCFSNSARMLLPYCHAKAMTTWSGLPFPKIPV